MDSLQETSSNAPSTGDRGSTSSTTTQSVTVNQQLLDAADVNYERYVRRMRDQVVSQHDLMIRVRERLYNLQQKYEEDKYVNKPLSDITNCYYHYADDVAAIDN